MGIGVIILIALHVLTGVFWAGSTFTLARSGGAGGEALFRPQMGAAVIAVLTGVGMWHLLHAGNFALGEKILAAGALAAIAAAGVQGALHRKQPATAQRIAAGLLAITVVCMVVSRYV